MRLYERGDEAKFTKQQVQQEILCRDSDDGNSDCFFILLAVEVDVNAFNTIFFVLSL